MIRQARERTRSAPHTRAPSASLTVEAAEGADPQPHQPPTVPLAPSQEGEAPRYGTRGTAPGRRGCWAVSKAGNPCAAPRRGDGEYCNAHSGVGVAENPSGFSEAAVRKSAEVRRRRAELRLVLGSTRLDTPRGVLRAQTLLNAERVAGRVLGAVLDPDVRPETAAKLGLDLIEAVDPRQSAEVTMTGNLNGEAIEGMGFRELLSFAQGHGIDPSPSLSTVVDSAQVDNKG